MSPNIDTPKVETKSVTEERINKVLDVFSGTDWTSGFPALFPVPVKLFAVRKAEIIGLIFGLVETTVFV